MRGPVDRWLVLGPEGDAEEAEPNVPGQEGSQPMPWPARQTRPPRRHLRPGSKEWIEAQTRREEARDW